MTTTSDVKVTPGSGANVATYSVSEDAETKQIQRVGLNKSDGTELALPAALGSTTKANSLSVTLASDQTLPAFAATPTVSVGAAGVDGSTTITLGGTAQNLFGATVPVNGFEICNPDASNDLWISDSTTAAANGTGSYRVAANGGTYTTPPGYKPIQAVSIVGAVTAQKITARRW